MANAGISHRPLPVLSALLGLCLPLSLAAAETSSPAEPIRFRHQVQAALSKAGCNMGLCHGNQNGKGGFKLSLRGQDPAADWAVLSHGLQGRRTNVERPAESLLLLKPTMKVAHEGGLRLHTDSPEYAILRDWIAQGMPNDPADLPRLVKLEVTPHEIVVTEPAKSFQLHVQATFSDGSRRELGRLPVFEPANLLTTVTPDGLVERQAFGETTVLVRYLHLQVPVQVAWVPARPDFAWQEPAAEHPVDQQIERKLQALRILPSAVCDDRVFLRRAYLDLLGMLPTATEARAFLADASPDKRSQLVNHLLDRPEFADYWALKWADLLRNEEKVLDIKGVQNFQAWIRRSLLENQPLNEFVRELLAGQGSSYDSPAANYYRANRDPIARAEATAQLFLGTRLQCAKCHNHPFEKWTQDDYYQWAGVFAKVQYKIMSNARRDKNDNHEFDGEQVIFSGGKDEVTNPRTETTAPPKFLGGNALEAKEPRLAAVAKWVTSPENPLFARVQVNRIWFNLMGRGIVEPIDDFRSTNPPSNPALLDYLTREFVAHQFDVKWLIREIMTSRAYQRVLDSNPTNATDETNFSHGLARRLTAEPLLDAMHQVCDVPAKFQNFPRGMRAVQLPGVQALSYRKGSKLTEDDRFLKTFGKPPRLLTCECERATNTTLVMAFQLLSGPLIDQLLTDPQNRLANMLATDAGDQAIIEELYWNSLSRGPNAAELNAALEVVRAAENRRLGLEDVLWSLLNAKEFVLRE